MLLSFLLSYYAHPRDLHSFPTRRSSDLTDNVVDLMAAKLKQFSSTTQEALKQLACLGNIGPTATLALVQGTTDRKSTRLNSSHRCISYAVFCLKKKKKKNKVIVSKIPHT